MPNKQDDVTLFEIIGGFALLAALAAFLLHWIGLVIIPGGYPVIILLIVTLGLLGLVSDGLRTGQLALRGGSVTRADKPVTYWGFLLFYLTVSAAFVGTAIWMMFES